MNTELMFSSKTDLWSTPQAFFDKLHEEFNFELDVCADSTNHKCPLYFDLEANGLTQEWDKTFWMNPPYGREIYHWIKKAYEESFKHNVTGVLLLPARTDTRWFHDYILHNAEIRFIKGRLKFGDAKNAAPFPSMVVIFKAKKR